MLKSRILMAALATAVAASAQAYEAGDFVVRMGATTVDPQGGESSDVFVGAPVSAPSPGVKVDVEDDTKLGITGTYFINSMFAVELLAAFPFEHNIIAAGDTVAALGATGVQLGSTKHLPPTLSLQFYPMGAESAFQPYVGAGINYTIFFEEKATSALNATIPTIADNAAGAALGLPVPNSTSLELDDSISYAVQAGFDYMLSDSIGINAAVWYIDISTEATITSDFGGGTVVNSTVDVDIDPMVYNLGFFVKI